MCWGIGRVLSGGVCQLLPIFWWLFKKFYTDLSIVENDMGMKEGKMYFGRLGADTTELGFWSAAVSQAYLSAASLGQLFIRRHTGGVSWGIW